jgi:phosphatidylinositol alpha-mannosyltransferase
LLLLPLKLRQSLEVLIAGDGPDRAALEKFVRAHKLINVVFLGFIDEADKADLLASAELAVFPSLGGESFGIVLIEAMAAGSAVVLGGDNAGYASVLGEWPETLVNPRSPAAFSATLEQFLTDSGLRQTIHAAQQTAVQAYDTAVAGQQIVRLYEQALLHRQPDVR